MEDFDAPRCPRCLDDLGWTKTDNYMAGDTHLVERQLMCPQCSWVGNTALFVAKTGGLRVASLQEVYGCLHERLENAVPVEIPEIVK